MLQNFFPVICHFLFQTNLIVYHVRKIPLKTKLAEEKWNDEHRTTLHLFYPTSYHSSVAIRIFWKFALAEKVVPCHTEPGAQHP